MKYNFNERGIAELLQLINTPKKIIITTHYKPDGDAMGSSLGLFNFFTQLNHEVKVITPSDYPDFLAWLPGNAGVVNYLKDQELSDNLLKNADMIFCLDFNSPDRVEKMEQSLLSNPATKILLSLM